MINRWIIPWLRRLVQVLSVALLIALPVFALYTHYQAARAMDDLPQNTWRGIAIRSVDRLVADSPQRKDFVENTQGTFWSARIFKVSLSDPLAGVEAIVSSRAFYIPLLWSLAIPLAVSVLLGRVFCGWICPMNTLLELVDKCRRILKLAEIRERDVKFSLNNKYVMLVLALVLVGTTSVPFLAMVYPPAVLSREMHLLVFGSGVGIGVYLVLAICAIELFVSKRWWCRYICPGGALYALLGRFRLIRVRRREDKCIQCGDCVRVCQFDLRPMLVQTTGMECTNCGSCIANCNSHALHYRLVLPLPAAKKANGGTHTGQPPAADAAAQQVQPNQQTTGVKVSVIALLLSLLLPQAAAAHHILGLPHYSYKENYPQVPTLEYPAQSGPYDILMTSYPGKPVPGEAATIAFYIKDRSTGKPYDRPVTVRVLKTATFGSNTVIHGPATHQPFDNQHKCTVTFPGDGEYITELTMVVEGQTEVIPFLMVAGEPTATVSILILIVAGLLLFVVTVRAIKRKRDRRKANRAQSAAPQAAVGPA